MREVDGAAAAGDVLPVQFADAGEVCLKRTFEAGGQQSNAGTITFALENSDAVVSKVDVFDPQPRGFEEAEATSVKEMSHEAVVTFETCEDGARFAPGKDDRQPRAGARARRR